MRVSKLVSLMLVVLFLKNNGNSQELLLNTIGCKIPNFNMTYQDSDSSLTCGDRYIFIRKIYNNTIQFNMKQPFSKCCYSYIQRLNDKEVNYSSCIPFKQKSKAILTQELFNVRCSSKKRLVYNDYYAVVKRIIGKKETLNQTETLNPEEIKRQQLLNRIEALKNIDEDSDSSISEYDDEPDDHKNESSYNVLLLGLDTMSRKRAYSSLNETVSYLKNNLWLDFRGYNKIALNTVPNLMALLSGRREYMYENKTCLQDMTSCNDMLIWSEFQKRGYVTAFAEDAMHNGVGIFQKKGGKGFRSPPTNHYMTPLFRAESKPGSSVCTGKYFSGMHILNYILDYTKTYKTKKFFGFFWINSFSRDFNDTPKPFDKSLQVFFTKLKDLGVLNNTFVIFFSDHGIRFGPVRYSVEAYYDERLPMLFMNIPDEFKLSHQYANLVYNQYRLTSPYDIYLTLWDILKTSTDEIIVPKAEDCPRCMSLFQQISSRRIASHAGIDEQWSTCHNLSKAFVDKEFGAIYSLIKATTHLNNISLSIPTEACTKCGELTFKNLVRTHHYSTNNVTQYYIAAIVMNPANVTYEVTVRKDIDRAENAYVYNVVRTDLISLHNFNKSCLLDKTNKFMCVCQHIKSCAQSNKRF